MLHHAGLCLGRLIDYQNAVAWKNLYVALLVPQRGLLLALPVGLFASAWAGVPFVPLNYRLTGEELERLVTQIAPSYLVAESARVDALSQLPQTRVVSREIFLARACAADAPDASWPMTPSGCDTWPITTPIGPTPRSSCGPAVAVSARWVTAPASSSWIVAARWSAISTWDCRMSPVRSPGRRWQQGSTRTAIRQP